MRTQPITMNNNYNNPNFKKLELLCPKRWDLDVMEATINNPSIKNHVKQLAKQGKDLKLCSNSIGSLYGLTKHENNQVIMLVNAFNKSEFIQKISTFDINTILSIEEKENMRLIAEAPRRNKLLEEVDKLNNEIEKSNSKINKFEAEEANADITQASSLEKPKKRSFFERLFGLNK